VLLGFPLADPVVGLVISAAIFVLLIGTIRSIGRRLMDGIEPDLLDRVEQALEHVDGIEHVDRVRLRWVGHRLEGDALVFSSGDATRIAVEAEQSVRTHVRNLDEFLVGVRRRSEVHSEH
jgi:divalent metal cation (Fe/Co/Zn/Cd) transporter